MGNVAPVKDEDAPLIASILAVIDQIDAMRNPLPTCKTCRHRNGGEADEYGGLPMYPHCERGYKPIAVDDGCNDWQANSAPLFCGND
jgi:hypothetical protein